MIGQLFGNYRALSLLGEGGMGAVYLAEHPEIGRRVAIKVLRPELIKDPQLLVRFLNEARAANAIRHPNIIEILDSGTRADGTPYLVMELLEGESLSGRLRHAGPLALREALEFTYQAASALAAAHGKGIIHRDLKPDNLFIIKDPHDPSRERIKVLDFGIAKLQTTLPGEGMHTRTGTLMGTPVYMSPEQCLGTRTLDQRSDVYSMGIILFEMLAGRPPFYSEGFGELVNMHLNIAPPSLTGINASVPTPVEAVVNKALAKQPDSRYQSAAELQAALRAAAGQSVIIRGSSSPDLASPISTGPGFTAILPDASTLHTGVGERHTLAPARPKRRGMVVALSVAALCAAGVVYFVASGRTPLGRTGTTTGTTTATTTATTTGTTGSSTGKGDDRADKGKDKGEARPDKKAQAKGDTKVDPKGETKEAATGTTTQPAAAMVKVTLQTRPPGATVVNVAGGGALGTTPLVIEQPASSPPMNVRLDRAGHETVVRELVFDRDRTEDVPLPAAPAGGGDGKTAVDDRGGKDQRAGKDGKKDKIKKTPGRTHHASPGDDEPAAL